MIEWNTPVGQWHTRTVPVAIGVEERRSAGFSLVWKWSSA